MDVREKLVELLGSVQQMGVIYRENQMDERYPTIEQIRNTEVAARLIANGVTVQEPPEEGRNSMRLCDLDEIKVCVDRQYENCHGYSGSKKAIYREAILAVKSILHAAKPVDAVPVVRCRECKYHENTDVTGFEHCCLYDKTVRYNDFCSYGKLKGGSDNG